MRVEVQASPFTHRREGSGEWMFPELQYYAIPVHQTLPSRAELGLPLVVRWSGSASFQVATSICCSYFIYWLSASRTRVVSFPDPTLKGSSDTHGNAVSVQATPIRLQKSYMSIANVRTHRYTATIMLTRQFPEGVNRWYRSREGQEKLSFLFLCAYQLATKKAIINMVNFPP